ncbi:MAG: GTPase Era [Bacteroidota bacterium]
MQNENTKAGVAVIVGLPNVGKSTLLNSIIGEKLSIVTPKPQTTRKKVLGIYSTEEEQIVFIDTPGHIKPRYELHRSMVQSIEDSLQETDVVLVLTDVNEYDKHEQVFSDTFMSLLKHCGKPLILAINKIDLVRDKKTLLPIILEISKLELFDEIIPISAIKKISLDELLKVITKYLPDSPFLYDPEYLSIQNERFFVSEIIRENIFKLFGEEIPFSTEVAIAEFKERENGKWHIAADIIIERDSQKKIIIGEKGIKIKTLGEQSRIAIEQHLNLPVFLTLFVKVRQKWRNNKNMLKSFGY